MASKDSDSNLTNLRQQIRAIDTQILELAAKRMTAAKEVAQCKLKTNRPIKDYQVEKELLARNKSTAQTLGIAPSLAEEITKALIKHSVLEQDHLTSVAKKRQGQSQKQIVIIGGGGQMGLWLSEFFESFGHFVCHYDEYNKNNSYHQIDSLDQVVTYDFIVLCTPISTTANVLKQLIPLQPTGVIFDICSLKSPLIETISQAATASLNIASIHPMFGPKLKILSGNNILVCDCGNTIASQQAKELFDNTTANVVTIQLSEHDPFINYILGFSHLMNLIFANVLVESDFEFNRLFEFASTTFQKQLEVTIPIVNENKDLYYEIQAYNDHTPKILEKLSTAVDEFRMMYSNKDRKKFVGAMSKMQKFFGE